MTTQTIPQAPPTPGMPGTPGASGNKAALRQRVLAARDALGEAHRRDAAAHITAALVALPAFRKAARVAAYAGFGTELDTAAFLNAVHANGKVLALPRVDRERRCIVLHQVAASAELVAGPFGIREPRADSAGLSVADIDFMLVPGVAFDRNGYRVGYGAGFYDRLLAGRGAGLTCVAAAFDCQVVEAVPVEPHDQRIDRLITESLDIEFPT